MKPQIEKFFKTDTILYHTYHRAAEGMKNFSLQDVAEEILNGSKSDNQPIREDNRKDGQPTNQSIPLPTKEEIEEKLQTDKQKTEIINSPKLVKEEDKKQAETSLRTVIEAELLIKRKQFSALVLKKLKEIMNRPLIYSLLNKDKRVERAVAKLEQLEKQQKSQEQENKENKWLVPGLIGGGVLVVLVVLGIVVVRRRKNKSK